MKMIKIDSFGVNMFTALVIFYQIMFDDLAFDFDLESDIL